MPSPIIVHHKAALDSWPFPPNSLEAVRACLEADALFIEIDVLPLRRDDYLLVHDFTLEDETTGTGEVSALTPDDARTLFIRDHDVVMPQRPPLLSDVVGLLCEFGGAARLQIDYKAVFPMGDDEPLRRLINLIKPLGERVIVSTGADWHLRALRRLAPWLDLGFDIGFYLDYRPNGSDPRLPPHKQGAYGYHDDHLLSVMRLQPTADYLALRCDALLHAFPSASVWYVNHHLLAHVLDDGFNMADWLHTHNVRLDAWTLDADNQAAAEHAPRLLAAGVDLFTTNTPAALAALLTQKRHAE
ncbi:MAG: hypothetical protein HC828_16980 [Blastochloris sp.]|nr:hypothetical protein [Blastochloris sp.]